MADSYAGNYGDVNSQKILLQQRHYMLLSELQTMAREVPPKFQQRLPNELLSDIARSLLDGTVFHIVSDLKEIQHMKEKSLLQKRMEIVNAVKIEKQELAKKHRDILTECQATKPHTLPLVRVSLEQAKEDLEKKRAEEMTRMDMKLILELDQTVSDQQVTLEKSGVPGFFVTNNPTEINLQMYILEFIRRLSNTDLPS